MQRRKEKNVSHPWLLEAGSLPPRLLLTGGVLLRMTIPV
jgi:hypothetical protein